MSNLKPTPDERKRMEQLETALRDLGALPVDDTDPAYARLNRRVAELEARLPKLLARRARGRTN